MASSSIGSAVAAFEDALGRISALASAHASATAALAAGLAGVGNDLELASFDESDKRGVLATGGCAVDDKMMGDEMKPMTSSSPEVGDVPPALADLVGARAGQAENAVMERGYEMRNSSKSADSVYTNWRETGTGECVTIRTTEGRYESIIYGAKPDCEASDTMAADSGAQFGETPAALADLVGARAGQAEGALMQRGYENRGGSKSADSSYTNWEEMSTGECVTIRTMDGRYESIIYGSKADCN